MLVLATNYNLSFPRLEQYERKLSEPSLRHKEKGNLTVGLLMADLST